MSKKGKSLIDSLFATGKDNWWNSGPGSNFWGSGPGADIFAKGKDNWWNSGPGSNFFGPGQSRDFNISGAGSVDDRIPVISGGGRRSTNAPDIGGMRNDPRPGFPRIGGAGRADPGIPQIAGDPKRTEKKLPSLGNVPMTDSWGNPAGEANLGDPPEGGVPNISGAPSFSMRGTVEGFLSFLGGNIYRTTMRSFRPMSDDERAIFDEIHNEARAMGVRIRRKDWYAFEAAVMMDQIDAREMWDTPIGKKVRQAQKRRKRGTPAPAQTGGDDETD